jgi:hypothetical protein
MKKRTVVDLVNSYADYLVRGDLPGAGNLLETRQSDELTPLLRLTDQIAAVLIPVSPDPEYIQQLGTTLAAAAAPAEIIIGFSSKRRVWLGALLSGSLLSALGVLALVWMRRSRRSTVAAG